MQFELKITSDSPNELIRIMTFVADMVPRASTTLMPAALTHEIPEQDSAETRSQEASTRERGLNVFLSWAEAHGLRVRRSGSRDQGTFIASKDNKEWPVEVVCSKKPRISLRKQWAEPENLVLAYVWLDEGMVSLMRYREAAELLEGAAFTEDGFYTTPLSAQRRQDLLPYRDRMDVFEEAVVDTLMETGAFGSREEALEYERENPMPGLNRSTRNK